MPPGPGAAYPGRGANTLPSTPTKSANTAVLPTLDSINAFIWSLPAQIQQFHGNRINVSQRILCRMQVSFELFHVQTLRYGNGKHTPRTGENQKLSIGSECGKAFIGHSIHPMFDMLCLSPLSVLPHAHVNISARIGKSTHIQRVVAMAEWRSFLTKCSEKQKRFIFAYIRVPIVELRIDFQPEPFRRLICAVFKFCAVDLRPRGLIAIRSEVHCSIAGHGSPPVPMTDARVNWGRQRNRRAPTIRASLHFPDSKNMRFLTGDRPRRRK